MNDKNTRLADARQREAEARKEFEAARAAVAAQYGHRRGWRKRQDQVVEAARAYGLARAELEAAKAEAGLRKAGLSKADALAAAVGGCKLLVALVLVPSRAADALQYGEGDPIYGIEDGVASCYRLNFDVMDEDPPSHAEWVETVRTRFGATAGDADEFRCLQVAAVDPVGGAARVIADALAREG